MLARRAGRKWARLPQEGPFKPTRSSSTYSPGGRIPKRPFEKFDPTAPKKEAPVCLRLPSEGIKLPDGRRLFAEQEFELRRGEHVCVIGSNGHGKTCFWKALSGRESVTDKGDGAANKQFSFMSFSMHKDFVTQYKDTVVCDVLGGSKDALARTLIVTLGLYPVWYKRVGVLSTGEIRKVLLAYVLSKSPRVVVLDKPFDGLDGPSRENLKAVLSQLCQGFPRLLVEGFAKRAIDPSELVLITHRLEEIPTEVSRVVGVRDLAIEYQGLRAEFDARMREQLSHEWRLKTESQDPSNKKSQGLSSTEATAQASAVAPKESPAMHDAPPPPRQLPPLYRPMVTRAETLENDKTRERLSTVVELQDVHMEKGDYTILHSVSWGVRQGQCWALKGLNGAGKSSIVKLITEAHEDRLRPCPTSTSLGASSEFTGHVAVGVRHLGLVSTETHLHLASRYAHDSAAAVVLSGLPPLALGKGGGGGRRDEALRQWAHLLRLSGPTLARPFGELSQGQQKLAIIARALIGAPELVIMDEACQGLDSEHRALVLSLLDRLAHACSGWMSLLFISHHEDETLEAVSHVLDLKRGRVVFQGLREEYEARHRKHHHHHRKHL